MTWHNRVLAGLMAALGIGILATIGWAQSPEPKPPAPEAAPDPAVEAILATRPTTPAELVRAAVTLADLDRADLAKRFLKKVIAEKLDRERLADLGEQVGSATFVDLALREALRPESKQLADAVLAALNARLRNPERIYNLIAQLKDRDKFIETVKGLQEAQSAAIGPLVAVLANPARKSEHANVRAALVEMGMLARRPLEAIVEQADAALALQAIEVLGAMNDPKVALYLFRPYLAEASDPSVRQAAETQLQRLTGRLPDRREAVQLLTDAARAYLEGRQPIEGVVNDRVDLWSWDPALRRVGVRNVAPDEAARQLAARLAHDAFAIAPDNHEVEMLYLVALLEQAAYENGLDRPLAEKDPACVEAKKFGAKAIHDAMRRSMAEGRLAAAAAAARLLGSIGTAEELLSGGNGPVPLLLALQSPDRRLRLAAIEAIVRLQPLRPFAGSSEVPKALAFFASTNGRRRALVASRNHDVARELAGQLSTAGYQVDTLASGKELLLTALQSPDYELAFIDATIDQPTADILLQQLRRDPRTASLRVGLVARDGMVERALRMAGSDPLVKVFSRPRDEKAFQWQLNQLSGLAPREFVGFEARQRQAVLALGLLAELYRSSQGVYDLRSVEKCLLASLYNPTLSVKAAAILANVNSAGSQRALVDAASEPMFSIERRRAAAKAFRQNTERFGILLTTEEIRRQYQRYNESKGQDADTQKLLGLILDCLEVSAPTKTQKP